MTPNQGGPDNHRPPVLPPLRSFRVRRSNDYDAEVTEAIVHAHELSFTPHGALCFVIYVVDNGEMFSQMPRVFNVGAWDDVEEILRTESLLVH